MYARRFNPTVLGSNLGFYRSWFGFNILISCIWCWEHVRCPVVHIGIMLVWLHPISQSWHLVWLHPMSCQCSISCVTTSIQTAIVVSLYSLLMWAARRHCNSEDSHSVNWNCCQLQKENNRRYMNVHNSLFVKPPFPLTLPKKYGNADLSFWSTAWLSFSLY